MPIELKAKTRKFLREWVFPLILVGAVFGSFRSAIADWNDVPTGSMKPTILEGDRIFVNKLAFGLRVPFTMQWITQWDQPERGDVVVLFSPANGLRLVKRVVGLPGDVIELRGNRLSIDGDPLDYGRLDEETIHQVDASEQAGHGFATEVLDDHRHPVMTTPALGVDRSFGPITVPAGHYFVLGDNRDDSADSRVFGFVPRDRIVGRATGVILSLDRDNHYLPRTGRFFRSLP